MVKTMHLARYQLNCDPFNKSLDTKDAVLTTDFKECAGRLDYLAKTRGLALVCAAPGYGKSFCAHAFAARQNPNLVHVIYLCMTTLTSMEFYRQLCVALGLEAQFRKSDMFRQIQEYLDYLHTVKRQHVIIVVDEAQYLPASVLRDLKLLMNFDYDSSDRFSLVLLGQPVLADTLCRQIHEALRQRIVVNYSFCGLAESEATTYAKDMMTKAGGTPEVFSEAALHAAYNCSNGAIRVYGRVLTGALMVGAAAGVDVIDAEMIMAAANEMEIR
jgi:type II secretory pathway predicted ATPase ExeA